MRHRWWWPPRTTARKIGWRNACDLFQWFVARRIASLGDAMAGPVIRRPTLAGCQPGTFQQGAEIGNESVCLTDTRDLPLDEPRCLHLVTFGGTRARIRSSRPSHHGSARSVLRHPGSASPPRGGPPRFSATAVLTGATSGPRRRKSVPDTRFVRRLFTLRLGEWVDDVVRRSASPVLRARSVGDHVRRLAAFPPFGRLARAGTGPHARNARSRVVRSSRASISPPPRRSMRWVGGKNVARLAYGGDTARFAAAGGAEAVLREWTSTSC
jgi:hypothetical protein